MSNPRAPLDIRKAREAAAAIVCEWCQEPAIYGSTPPTCEKHKAIAGRHPWRVGNDAIDSAERLHDMPSDVLIHWPWRAVNELAGPLVPGRLTYVAAFPSNGKTTFLMHCLAHFLDTGKTVTYLPLEAEPGEVFTRLACYRTGVNADEALSKRLRLRADDGETFAQEQLDRLADCYRAMRTDEGLLLGLRIEPIRALTLRTFERAIKAAKAMESDVLVVDHVDHIEHESGEGGAEIELSNRLQQAALNAAIELQIPVILASQLNSSRTGGDALAHYRPPAVDWLYNKGKKEQNAATILGLFRPTNPDADQDLVTKVSKRQAEPATIVLPNRMGVAGMKLRYGGAMKERSVMLKYEHGALTDVDALDARGDAAASAGYATGRGASEFGRGW